MAIGGFSFLAVTTLGEAVKTKYGVSTVSVFRFLAVP